jgi:carbon-monoxide dehydrogenase large subunit
MATDSGLPDSLIGRSVPRKEDRKLLLGRGAFVEDIDVPGTLWANFVRSPHAHARIRSVDASAALQNPKVVTVISGHDVHPRYPTYPTVPLAKYGGDPAPYDLIASDKARHVGEIVAVVVAEDRYTARDAADMVVVDYDVLPAVGDPEQAVRGDAPRVHDDRSNEVITWRQTTGDVSQAFEEAEVIIRDHFVNQRIHAVPMEPRAGLAQWELERDMLTVWATTQTPHDLKEVMAEVLRLPEDNVRVVAPDVGGGFGAKAHGDPEYVLLAIASREVGGRALKWVATRSEDFLGMHHARGKASYVEYAATLEGILTGVRVRHFADLGAYPKGPEASLAMSSAIISVGTYRIPAADIEVHATYTNRTPDSPYRGAGRPEGIFLVERAVDLLANEIGMDPGEVRRRNYIPADAFPYKTSGGDLFDSGSFEATLDLALGVSNYPELRQRQARLREEGRYLGIGFASWAKTGGGGPAPLDPSANRYEWGRVKVNQHGTVTVYTGSSPHGQGGETAFAQIIGQVLYVPVEDIEVLHGDTAVVEYGMGTYASRGLVVGGTAAYNAAQKVLAKMKRLAGHLMQVASEDVAFEHGVFSERGRTEPQLSFTEVAQAAYMVLARPEQEEYGLDESSFFQPSGLTYNSGTYIAVVEVDPDTGDVDMQTMYCVDDQGVIVNPMIVEGQVHGGAAQGIGPALYEHIIYDEDQQLLTGSLMDYALPTAEGMPQFVTEQIETPSPMNPLGVKGMGEGPTTGAPPAVVNAVVDALQPFGVRHIEMPLTPERVWRAIETARQTSS